MIAFHGELFLHNGQLLVLIGFAVGLSVFALENAAFVKTHKDALPV
jgi:hypothetical protein